MSFSLHFDPYSPTAREDYQRLREEVQQFDIVSMIKGELGKSRIHIALSKKLVLAVKYLDDSERDSAILSLLENCDLLYPIMPSVLLTISEVFDDLTQVTQDVILKELDNLTRSDSHIFRVDIHLSFAIRVLARRNSANSQSLMEQIFDHRLSPLVRRDIIAVMANWGNWYWLSDLKNKFRQLRGAERRAFIAASYSLKEEGQHWRDHIGKELNPFEKFVMRWAGDKANRKDRKIPL